MSTSTRGLQDYHLSPSGIIEEYILSYFYGPLRTLSLSRTFQNCISQNGWQKLSNSCSDCWKKQLRVKKFSKGKTLPQVLIITLRQREITHSPKQRFFKNLSPQQKGGHYESSLKAFSILWFSDVFRGYRKWELTWNKYNCSEPTAFECHRYRVGYQSN